MTRRTGPVAVIATIALLLLGACGDDEPATPSPEPVTFGPTTQTDGTTTDTSTTSPGATPTASGATGGPATETAQPDDDTWSRAEQTDNFPSGGGTLLPVGVRTGFHPGYDRVVFDLAGEGQLGWRVTYVDTAIEDPKGEEVDLMGDAVSEVIISGLRMPEESEHDDVLRAGTFEVEELEEVEEIHVSGLFEGQLQVLIGLEDEVPFRVFVLEDPMRLVVDYQTS